MLLGVLAKNPPALPPTISALFTQPMKVASKLASPRAIKAETSLSYF